MKAWSVELLVRLGTMICQAGQRQNAEEGSKTTYE